MRSSKPNHEMQGRPSCPQQPMARNQDLALSTITTPAGAKKWKPKKIFSALRSLIHILSLPTSPCRLPSLPAGPSEFPPLGNRVMGTLFGYRKGHVHLAVQENPKCPPILLLELATPTSTLVKEMASGLVRIALECDKTAGRGKLLQEPVWTMYCNGKKTGYGMKKVCSESDMEVLSLLQAVSMGAGVLPTEIEGAEGDLMYMRARFERVVGSKDSEAFYMINPDGTGGPELSIFLKVQVQQQVQEQGDNMSDTTSDEETTESRRIMDGTPTCIVVPRGVVSWSSKKQPTLYL